MHRNKDGSVKDNREQWIENLKEYMTKWRDRIMNRLLKVTLMTVMIGCLSGCSTKINNESVNTPNASTDTEVRTNEGVQDELLPYGTVVLLKDSTKRIMIYGHNSIYIRIFRKQLSNFFYSYVKNTFHTLNTGHYA